MLIKIISLALSIFWALFTGLFTPHSLWPGLTQPWVQVSKTPGNAPNSPIAYLNKGWRVSGARLDSIYLEVSGQTKKKLTWPEIVAESTAIAKKLKLKNLEKSVKKEKGLYSSLYLTGKSSYGGPSQIIIQSLEPGNGERGKTFIVVNMTLNSLFQAEEANRKLNALVSAHMVQSEEAIVFQGTQKKLLSEVSIKNTVSSAMSRLRAKKYPPVQDITFWTITGYTPLLPRSFEIGPDKVNLQWAYHPDKKAGITKVFLGYPLIMSDY